MIIKKLSVFLTIGLILMNVTSCDRSNPSGIPFVPVNFQLVVSNPDFSPLLAVGGHVTIGGGSRGIIVYRFSPEEFRAYDRHCTFQIDEICQVSVDQSGIIAVDTECCDSHFLLVDGAPIEGPANIGLHQYNTAFDGNTLSIFN